MFDKENTISPDFNIKLKNNNNKDINLNIKDYQQQRSLSDNNNNKTNNNNNNNKTNNNTNEQPKLSIPENDQQGAKEPEFNLALAMFLLLTVIGFIIYIINYLSKQRKWKEVKNKVTTNNNYIHVTNNNIHV